MEVNNDKFGSRGRSEIKRGPTLLLAQPSKIAIKQLMPCCNRYNFGKREKEGKRHGNQDSASIIHSLFIEHWIDSFTHSPSQPPTPHQVDVFLSCIECNTKGK